MSQYKLLRDVFFPEGEGATYTAGTVIEMSDEQAKGYVERGSIAPHDPNTAVKEEVPEAPVAQQEVQTQQEAPLEQPQSAPSTSTEESTPKAQEATSSPTPEQLEKDFENTSSEPSEVQLQ